MTINVTGPDGSNISFPDGTPGADIAAAMEQHFGGSKAPAAPKPERGITGNIDAAVRSAAEGVPIIGGTLNSLDAATNALLSYANSDVKGSWSDRYKEAKRLQDAKSKGFAEDHPVIDAALGMAGGIGAGGALLKAAPAVGARVLGLTGETLPAQVTQGALSGASIGAADALTHGEDVKTGGEIGAFTGVAAPVVGRVVAKGVEAVRGMRQPPHVPSNTVDIADIPVRRSVGQTTGDTEAIAREQMALRGNDNSREQRVAREYFDAQKGELEQAREAIAARMHPEGQVVARTPEEGASLAASQLADNQRANTLAAQRAVDAMMNEGRSLHANLGGQQLGDMLHASSPLEAAGIVSHGVGQAAQNAQDATDAAYRAMRELPGRYHPASFNTLDQEITSALNRGDQPVRVNPQNTPQTHSSIEDLTDLLSGIRQQRDPETGRIIPKPALTASVVDDARKRLNTFYGDALAAARTSNNWSDVRGMRRVMSAFDDAVAGRLADGRYIGGDPQSVLEAFANARGAHANFRRTFTSQGAGDQVGQAIQNIVGRHEGQAMPPEQVRATLYGNGALPIKIAQRFIDIFGRGSQEVGAIKQGFFSHLTQDALGQPLAADKAADNLQKAMRGTLGQAYFTAPERARINAYADRLRASIPEKPTDVDNIIRSIGSGEKNAMDLVAKINTLHGGGQAERVVQRLKSDLSPAEFAAVKQGQWAWLNEHKATSPLDVGSKKVVSNIDEFLKNKPLADAFFSTEEQALIRSYGDLMRQITPPSGTVNYSNTASVLGKMFRGTLDTMFGTLGAVTHGPAGLIVGGYASDKAVKAMTDVTRAAKVAKSLYGTPQGVNAMGDLQRKLVNLASFTARTTQPALAH